MASELTDGQLNEWKEWCRIAKSLSISGREIAIADSMAAMIDEIIRLRTTTKAMTDLLKRLHSWDHMATAADGPYWKSEIEKLTPTLTEQDHNP